MKEVYKYILENISSGKLEKQVAVKLIAKLKQKEDKKTCDIAIVGIGVKLPNANSLDEFWNSIMSGCNFTRDIPLSRKDDLDKYLMFCGLKQENIKYNRAAYLENIDSFDYNYFHIAPKEAELMDPKQRLLLETVWQAIEDSGYGGGKLKGTRTGVYIGFEDGVIDSYGRMIYDVSPSSAHMAITGNLPSIISGRISYLLDLKGPSMLVDTACSSSLVAVDLACQALENGSCTTTIAGGIRINLVPLIRDSNIGIESSDGITRSFDFQADGSGEGEGIAVVILKPLENAVKDKDNIYAVIKGHGVNQDGSSVGLTAPNPASQADMIASVWEKSGIDPETISYIETHGTATNIGDPIEIKGISNAFRRYTDKKQFCAISSVKSNTGHTFECSGVLNLIKAVLALKNEVIPPSTNFNRPNGQVDFCQSPVYINVRPKKWKKNDFPRRCGVNSFGISGTNCHFIVEESSENNLQGFETAQNEQVFLLSAASEYSLIELLKRYNELFSIGNTDSLQDLCYTVSIGRGHYNYRIALLVKSLDELVSGISLLSNLDMEGIRNLKEDTIFYGYHKATENENKIKSERDIHRYTKLNLNKRAEECMEQYFISKSQNLLKELCTLYTAGAEIGWDKLYYDSEVHKLSLPPYPFEPIRSWIKIPQSREESGRSDLFHNIVWIPCYNELPQKYVSSSPKGTVIIFRDSGSIADKLIEKLSGKLEDIIEVSIEDTYKQITNHKCTVGKDEDSYVELLKNITKRPIKQIIHLASISGKSEVESLSDLNLSQQRGYYSIFFLSRALIKMNWTHDIDIMLISEYINEVTGREERINPENATLFGIADVIRVEFPQLHCRCIDVDMHIAIEDILGEINMEQQCYHVAYRRGARYIREFRKTVLEDIQNDGIEIKDGGTYLISGGTGGMGLEIAKFLAEKANIKLALVNRGRLPEESEWNKILELSEDNILVNKIRSINEIRLKGSKVLLYSADVSKVEETEPVLKLIREECGKINGMIHCAGAAGQGLITQKELSQMGKVLDPKIYGTWILNKLTKCDNPNFTVLCSSIASLGGAGQSDYTAANAYLDSFSAYRNRMGLKTLTINWAAWKETGMWLVHGHKREEMFIPLKTNQAIEAFGKVLYKNIKNIFVGEVNYNADEIKLLYNQMSFKLSGEIMKKSGLQGTLKKNIEGNQYWKLKLVGKEHDNDYTSTEKTVARMWNEVLGHEQIDIYDNFYELGGDSIKALKIVNSINKELGINVKLTDILKNLTVHRFSNFLDGISSESVVDGEHNIYSSIVPVEKKSYYPLSSAQKRIFVLDKIENMNTSYNITRAYMIQGKLDFEKFEDSVKQLIARHESLRTSFSIVDGEPVQFVQESIDFQLTSEDTNELELNSRIESFIQCFNLNSPPLLRIKIFKLSEKKQILVLDVHHIITDGASMDILVQELAFFYKDQELPVLEVQYKDYSVWQQTIINDLNRHEHKVISQQENYWINVYKDRVPVLNMPTDYPRTESRSFRGSNVIFTIVKELMNKISNIAMETGTTLFMILLAAYFILLSKLSGDEDIVVGIPIVGRSHEKLEGMVGILVNTVALRGYPSKDKRFIDFLDEIKQICLGAFENQDYQFDDLINKLGIKRDASRNPMFDTMFALQNVGIKTLEIEGAKFTPHEFGSTESKFDLTMEAYEKSESILFRLEYCTTLFSKETIDRFSRDYLSILNALPEKKFLPIGDYELEGRECPKVLYPEDEDLEFNF